MDVDREIEHKKKIIEELLKKKEQAEANISLLSEKVVAVMQATDLRKLIDKVQNESNKQCIIVDKENV